MTQVVRQSDVLQTLHTTDDRLGALERTDNVPVGSILMYGGYVAPPGYLLCDGSEVSRTQYANLFGTVGTSFGAGDGSTTFNLPNLQSRMPVGYSPGGSPGSAMGQTGGEERHVMTTNEMPSHSHTVTDPGHKHANYLNFGSGAVSSLTWAGNTFNDISDTSTISTAFTGITVDNNGGGASHNNMPPYITLNFIIATGIRAS